MALGSSGGHTERDPDSVARAGGLKIDGRFSSGVHPMRTDRVGYLGRLQAALVYFSILRADPALASPLPINSVTAN